MDFISKIKNLRRVGTPEVLIKTLDQPACIQKLAAVLDGPKVEWDLLRGMSGFRDELGNVDPEGQSACQQAFQAATRAGGPDAAPVTAASTTNPVSALEIAQFLPANTILFMQNVRYYFSDGQRITDGTIGFSQALINTRNPFKSSRRMLVLLCDEATVPSELSPDIVVVDEPLPTETQLSEIVTSGFNNWNASNKTKLELPDEKTLLKATNALRGIESMFAAEQVCSISLTRKGLNFDEMYDRKRQAVNATPGLTVMPTTTFADLEGYEVLKEDWREVINSRQKVRLIVFQDEIEKGTGQDTSGTNMEMLEQQLTEMQERRYSGYILLGPPGVGKSAIAKAMAGEAGVECWAQSLSSTKNKYVGESVSQLRRQYKIIRGASGGEGVIFVATCNSIQSVATELQRRYKLGIYVMGFPDDAERQAIWRLYMTKYELPKQKMPDDFAWTGAEIENCCERAWSRNISLMKASERIVPVFQASRDKLEGNMSLWSGKYNSASTPGVFKYDSASMVKRIPVPVGPGREIRADPDDD